jgi:two-component system chemotaxis response regulator CheY
MRVGLLEDDVAIQEMLMLVLQDEGYTPLTYSDAYDCLDALGITGKNPVDSSVDLMIVDLRLNGPLSGIEVIEKIRQNEELQSLPIILTTAATFHDTGSLHHLKVALLEKPFSVDEIIELINDLTKAQPSK